MTFEEWWNKYWGFTSNTNAKIIAEEAWYRARDELRLEVATALLKVGDRTLGTVAENKST